MDDQQNEALTPQQMQDIWNEEATKLDAGEPAVEPLAPAPASQEEPPQEDPAPVEAPAAEEKVDPLASLPEEVRAILAKVPQLEYANAQLLQHVKTAEGRVAAMQREFAQARQAATQVGAGEAPTQTQIAQAAKTPEKWTQLKQDFPEWAGAMEEYVAAQLGAVQAPQNVPGLTQEQVQELVKQSVTDTEARMQKMVDEAFIEGKHENWKDTVKTPEFFKWFTSQPAETQALADSRNPRDAITMLDLYEQAKAKPVEAVKQERGARLAAAATTRPGQTPPPKTVGDMTPAELWNYEAAKREKERAQRGF